MFRQRIPFTQMAIATMLGVAGGVYIYRPYFEPLQKSPGQQNQDVPKNQSQLEENYLSVPENPEQAEARGAASEAGGLSEPEATPEKRPA
ncbi:protein PIGBOS1 [Centroberyx gerrardi]|uniref:protein PIGBOS1 n=1 Tax=Centroberyx gerrardi TaxID=166262 RepID=UPI003AAA8A13